MATVTASAALAGGACGQCAQQWPLNNATVATVPESVAMAGAGTRPVDSTVATVPINSGHNSDTLRQGRRAQAA